ncbi:MAG: penicillin-binding protein activator [Deltaproteobacteria bacterium]|nr:penicillin-binding protein activator [Deltaproteobacteria bacterium]
MGYGLWVLLSPIAYRLLPITVCCLLFTFIPYSVFADEPLLTIPSAPLNIKIGVILPLSGKYAAFGEQALKGILLAAGIFETAQDNKNPTPEIIIRDTRDDPVATAKAVEELAFPPPSPPFSKGGEGGVAGIIGPLLSITAMDAAKKAQELKVPVITLSQKDGLTSAGDYIFRNFLLPSEQAKAAAAYAINKLNYKKFAILYPNNPYGIELANLFKEEIKKDKGEIVAEGQYKEGQTYFGKEITQLFKIKETEKKEGRRKIKIFEPAVTADALYIPDYFDTVGLIAPYLAYYNIKDVKLLGVSGWNSPRLIELGGKYVEGAVFVDGFFAGSKRAMTAQFVNNFKNIYAAEPGIIEAQAYDATKIIIDAIIRGNGKKEEIRAALAHVKDFPGATGDITFDSNREAVKNLFMLEVKNGKIVEIN